MRIEQVRNVIGIPVPKVLAWDGGNSDSAESENILMEQQLEELWGEMIWTISSNWSASFLKRGTKSPLCDGRKGRDNPMVRIEDFQTRDITGAEGEMGSLGLRT